MQLALVADLHDNLVNFDKFLSLMTKVPCDGLLLAGDIGSPETYALIIAQMACPVWAVAGNLETDIGSKGYIELSQKFPQFHYSPTEPATFSIGRISIELRHHPFQALQPKGQRIPDLVIYGHTHRPDLTRSGKAWSVNPGTLSGWPNPATYTLCRLENDRLQLSLHRLGIETRHL